MLLMAGKLVFFMTANTLQSFEASPQCSGDGGRRDLPEDPQVFLTSLIESDQAQTLSA